MDDKTIFVEPKEYEEIDLDATQVAYLFGARPVLSIEQDLKLVEQGVKTRKAVQYGKKVVVKKEGKTNGHGIH